MNALAETKGSLTGLKESRDGIDYISTNFNATIALKYFNKDEFIGHLQKPNTYPLSHTGALFFARRERLRDVNAYIVFVNTKVATESGKVETQEYQAVIADRRINIGEEIVIAYKRPKQARDRPDEMDSADESMVDDSDGDEIIPSDYETESEISEDSEYE